VTTLPDANTRRLASQIGNGARWANATPADRARQGQAMRDGKRAKAIAQIDPEGQLTPDQLERQLQHAQKAEMARIRLARLKQQGGRQRGATKS
jgi:hypothetical protein